jgi:hypothetical protein
MQQIVYLGRKCSCCRRILKPKILTDFRRNAEGACVLEGPYQVLKGAELSSSGCLYIRASGCALTARSSEFRRQVMSGSQTQDFMFGGDLIVGVISFITLRLAYLHIGLSFSDLVSWS